MLTALSRPRLHCSLLGAVAFDSKGGDQIKTGLKGQTCVGKCQTIDLIDLVFMLQKNVKTHTSFAICLLYLRCLEIGNGLRKPNGLRNLNFA